MTLLDSGDTVSKGDLFLGHTEPTVCNPNTQYALIIMSLDTYVLGTLHKLALIFTTTV